MEKLEEVAMSLAGAGRQESQWVAREDFDGWVRQPVRNLVALFSPPLLGGTRVEVGSVRCGAKGAGSGGGVSSAESVRARATVRWLRTGRTSLSGWEERARAGCR